MWGLAIELRLVSFYYDRGFGQETAPPARLLCAIPYMSNFGVCENMRLFQCIQCGEKLGPGNATFGSEMCNKCRMQQAGIKQTDRAHTRPKGTDTALLQMMNTQMTLLNRNNTQIMAYMAESSSRAIIAENEKRAKEQQTNEDYSLNTTQLDQIKKDKLQSIQDGIDARKAKYGY